MAAEPEGEVPRDANEYCPGTASENAGKASACEGCPNQAACASAPKGPDPDVAAIAERLADVKHKVLVLSGKGGVGKSTFAAQLAYGLAAQGKEVGLLDIDICGPSVPLMLGQEGQDVHKSNSGWSPVYVEDNLAVMSIGFLLPNPDDAVIWRGPRKNGLIKQFLKDTDWGELDYLVVDAPPGTSDEHLSIVQFLKAAGVDGALVVTTPQEAAVCDVRKELSFCAKTDIRVLGVVENMSGLRAPLSTVRLTDAAGTSDLTAELHALLRAHAPHLMEDGAALAHVDVFAPSRGGAARMCEAAGVPFLGKVPLDPGITAAAEEGRSIFAKGSGVLAASAGAVRSVVDGVVKAVGDGPPRTAS